MQALARKYNVVDELDVPCACPNAFCMMTSCPHCLLIQELHHINVEKAKLTAMGPGFMPPPQMQQGFPGGMPPPGYVAPYPQQGYGPPPGQYPPPGYAPQGYNQAAPYGQPGVVVVQPGMGGTY